MLVVVMPEVVDGVRAHDAAGVAVVSHQEPWLDTSGLTRPLLLSIFAWVARHVRIWALPLLIAK
jgi:hypothetical protein